MYRLFIALQYLLPQHLLSRLAGKLAECRRPWVKNPLIGLFIRRYRVNMQDARIEDPRQFESFNDFFTRELKPGLRPLPADPLAVVSPADGAVSALGDIQDDSVFQAKGRSFSLRALLGGSDTLTDTFRNGRFATVYLSPRDYHRVHMPWGGTLQEMIHIPGDLFSVNQCTAENIDELFARNERAVCIFTTERGPMAVILVGAMIVAGIETVFAGHVCPDGRQVRRTDYSTAQPPITLARGAELGRFKLGSTAIVLFAGNMQSWQSELASGSSLQMGQQVGTMGS